MSQWRRRNGGSRLVVACLVVLAVFRFVSDWSVVSMAALSIVVNCRIITTGGDRDFLRKSEGQLMGQLVVIPRLTLGHSKDWKCRNGDMLHFRVS